MDNTKIKKLLSLYNDNSITIEEKRSIAVKLVDNGLLESNNNSSKIINETVSFIYNNKKYKDVGVNEVFEMLT